LRLEETLYLIRNRVHNNFKTNNPVEMESVRIMLLDTLRFGEVEIEEDKIVTFAQGLPGFEQYKTYIMLTPDPEIPLTFMQSLEDGELAFIVTDPFAYFPDYDFELPASVEEELQLELQEDVMVFAIVSISQDDEFSLNLLAPIILNIKEKIGRQVILHQTPYKTKHKVQIELVSNVAVSEEETNTKGGSSC
jgi:flagellar assembly factor FliW